MGLFHDCVINTYMRASEFLTEQELDEVTRRDFIKGAGAAAVTGMAGTAKKAEASTTHIFVADKFMKMASEASDGDIDLEHKVQELHDLVASKKFKKLVGGWPLGGKRQKKLLGWISSVKTKEDFVIVLERIAEYLIKYHRSECFANQAQHGGSFIGCSHIPTFKDRYGW